MINDKNIILMSDGYKISHWNIYPKDSEVVTSYFESRGGDFDNVVFFGLQYYIKKYLVGKVLTAKMIKEADEFSKIYFGNDKYFNKKGWKSLLKKHKGYLPIRIKAVEEGSIVPTHNVLMTVENTDPEFFWLTNYMETLLSKIWYSCTIATNSYYQKKTIKKYLEATGDPSGINWKLHDFGYRGVSSEETAGIGGMAHLTSFMGTDTIIGNVFADNYYNSGVCSGSIPASEHSTITSWGKANELEAFENMLDQYPEGTIACVSDSYDIFRACSQYWGTNLKEKILNRKGTLVVRPDSGNPIEVTEKVFELLWEKFGGVINKKGYRVLDSHVRIIQGDGIDSKMLANILENFQQKGISADNIAFGSGGGLLQKFDRDTLKFAFKCCSIKRAGVEYDVWKDPVGMIGKRSKSGKQCLVKRNGEYNTIRENLKPAYEKDFLETVFENGELIKEISFKEVRSNITQNG